MENWIGFCIALIGAVVIQVAIIRWILRINTQIKLLGEIRDELKIFNGCNIDKRSRPRPNRQPINRDFTDSDNHKTQ